MNSSLPWSGFTPKHLCVSCWSCDLVQCRMAETSSLEKKDVYEIRNECLYPHSLGAISSGGQKAQTGREHSCPALPWKSCNTLVKQGEKMLLTSLLPLIFKDHCLQSELQFTLVCNGGEYYSIKMFIENSAVRDRFLFVCLFFLI